MTIFTFCCLTLAVVDSRKAPVHGCLVLNRSKASPLWSECVWWISVTFMSRGDHRPPSHFPPVCPYLASVLLKRKRNNVEGGLTLCDVELQFTTVGTSIHTNARRKKTLQALTDSRWEFLLGERNRT